MHRTTTPLALLAVLAAAPLAPAVAQDEHAPADHQAMATHEGMPNGWMMRFDRAAATTDMADFRVMAPGWHVTTQGAGAGIFWQPEMTASGEYSAHVTIHLMKPAEHPEAFGLFVGGEELDAADQSYLYFLVRQDGKFLIKRRNGGDTENVVGWTANDAIPTASAEESTAYTLGIDVGADDVTFSVNGTPVQTLPAADLATDGVVGIRVNHRLDVHVEALEVDAES